MTLAVVATLAGCGDGDDGDDPQDPVTVTATETVTPTPSPTEVSSGPTESDAADPTPTAPPVDPSAPPTTYDEAVAHIAAATDDRVELGRFQSAEEKFYCSFNDEFIPASCEILDAVRDTETCADSMSPAVGRIELTRRGWAPFCNTDTIRQPGAPVLAAGQVAAWPDASVECVLEGIGLTCVQTAEQTGFFLGPGRYQVF